jgi:Na+-driven multidrug efflux pump
VKVRVPINHPAWSSRMAALVQDSALAEMSHAWWFFVALQPIGGVVFALDGVLLGAGDAAYLRTATVGGAVLGFLPLVWASWLTATPGPASSHFGRPGGAGQWSLESGRGRAGPLGQVGRVVRPGALRR